jgi:hypothetical protein
MDKQLADNNRAFADLDYQFSPLGGLAPRILGSDQGSPVMIKRARQDKIEPGQRRPRLLKYQYPEESQRHDQDEIGFTFGLPFPFLVGYILRFDGLRIWRRHFTA